ncbi:ovarian-specific serine/threonine-protein kinase Lok-like [Daphnia pulicaria]|uniref:ovarian-specific serine/threonine-protein kinase Lok-like n=1 Tax=Daphnia pulicaria TaxID=35523 RepID=UPI001EEA8EA6|nr:ovarian-specific serine/threonine-protein kinase Lok-like [Daphnia pulicaria]
MSTSSAESDPESSTSSYGNSGTPWGWLVWNIPQRTVGIPLGSTEGEHMATIGRGDYCTVTVSPTLVANSLFQRISRQHCTLEKSMEDGKFTISNHSPNGTFVNGERVDYLRTLSIDHGDVVALCSAESAANFTFYDNYHRFPGYHLHFNNKYLVLSIITSGLFGEVCRAIVKSNSSVVAIKTVHANKCEKPYDCVTVNPRGVDALRNEIAVLSQLDHPCIVKMLDSAGNWPESRMLIVMEFPGGGDLQQRMSDFSLLSEPNAKYWFVQMVSAIRYCHNRSPPIVHRNLNPSNVLLTSADEFAIVKVTKLLDMALE